MIKIFFLLEVLATSVFTVYTFFLRGEEEALMAGLAVFIAATPVCLWLSKFLVLRITKSVLKTMGISTRRAEAIVTLSEVGTVAVPLKGILTDGKFSVTDIIPEGMTEPTLLSYAASVEQYATHDLGRTIYKTALGRGLKIQKIAAFSEVPSCGVEAVINDVPIRVGTAQWIQSRGVAVDSVLWTKSERLAGEGKTPLIVGIGNIARGIIALKDEISSAGKSFIGILNRNNIEAAILTATNKPTAQSIARNFGIETVRTDLMPDDKAREVQILRAKKQIVAVIGDEVHDVPGLYAGDVSIYLNNRFDEEGGAGDNFNDMDFEIRVLDKFLTLREIALYAAKLIRINRWVAVLAWLVLVAAASTMLLDVAPFPFNPQLAAAGVLGTAVLVAMNSMRMWQLRRD